MAFKDITGKRFGRLTIQWPVGRNSDKKIIWLCLCDCGQLKTVSGHLMQSGKTRSCGCYRKETSHPPLCTNHGATRNYQRTPEYSSWESMKQRCSNPNNIRYKYYGGRGIYVCEQWKGKNGFINFLNDMGLRPEGMSLDRIDVNGNYEPSNCRWATIKEQRKSQRKFCLDRFSTDMLKEELKRRGVLYGD